MYRGGHRRRARTLILAIVLVTAGLMTVVVGGCGGDDPAAGATTTVSVASTATTASPATTASSATTTSTAAPSEPAGEPGATVSVSSTNGGYPKDNAPDWSQIKSVAAFSNASYGVRSLFVMLATDDVTAGSIREYWDLPYPEPGQGRIELLLTRSVADENEPPMVTGAYDFSTPQGQAELTGAAGIVLPGGTTVTFVMSDMECDVQVTAVSDTMVSGTFTVKDKWSEISGTFTAPVK